MQHFTHCYIDDKQFELRFINSLTSNSRVAINLLSNHFIWMNRVTCEEMLSFTTFLNRTTIIYRRRWPTPVGRPKLGGRRKRRISKFVFFFVLWEVVILYCHKICNKIFGFHIYVQLKCMFVCCTYTTFLINFEHGTEWKRRQISNMIISITYFVWKNF